LYKVGYPGAYTRTSCFLGFIAEHFGLRADFTQSGAHSGTASSLFSPLLHGGMKLELFVFVFSRKFLLKVNETDENFAKILAKIFAKSADVDFSFNFLQ
jgi:hypothetical protein